MHVVNLAESAVSAGENTIGPIEGTVHVFDVPVDLGEHLLRFPGWRHPEPSDWDTPDADVADPPTVPVEPVAPEPAVSEAVAAPEAPAEVPAVDGPDPEVEAPNDAQDAPDVADAPQGEPTTVDLPLPDALIADAHAAGPDGLTTATAVSAHGKAAYAALSALAADGRLVKGGRGLYVHPDHAQ